MIHVNSFNFSSSNPEKPLLSAKKPDSEIRHAKTFSQRVSVKVEQLSKKISKMAHFLQLKIYAKKEPRFMIIFSKSYGSFIQHPNNDHGYSSTT